MKRYLLTILAASLAIGAVAQSDRVWLSSTVRTIYDTPAANTGLNTVIVAENTAGQQIFYRANSSTVTWQRFSALGGGYAEDVAYTTVGDGSLSINASADDMGYIITDGGVQYCFWVVNYANHYYDVRGIAVESSDCDRIFLHVDNPAEDIAYYSITGRRIVLDRGIELTYNTLVFNEENMVYDQAPASESYESLSATISAPVPLCDTQLTLSADRFATAWGFGEEVITDTFITQAVQARTKAVQTPRDADNEQPLEAELGGSAPCEITFTAAVTDAAIYHRWEISTDAEFSESLYTDDRLEFTYTFTEEGTTYVRLTANNAAATCEYIGDTYSVVIGSSSLECPNAFSPGTSEGVNDEWKVSYRSIISFDCHIFNRWGHELAHLTDPSQGWDGRNGGKIVGPGVYYYVIKARGSDGKEYNLSGDINVIGSRRDNTTPATTE